MKHLISLVIALLSIFCANAQAVEDIKTMAETESKSVIKKQRGQVFLNENTYYRKGHLYFDGTKITRSNMSLYLDAEMQKIYRRSRRCFEAGNALAYTGCGFIALGGICFFGEVLSSDYGDLDAPTSGLGIVAGVTFAGFGAILGGTGILVRAAGKDRMISLGATQNGIGLTVKF